MKNMTRQFDEAKDGGFVGKSDGRGRCPGNSPDAFFSSRGAIASGPATFRVSPTYTHTHTHARLAIRCVVNTIQNGGPAHVVGAPVVEFIYAVPAALETRKTKTIVLTNTARVRRRRLCSSLRSIALCRLSPTYKPTVKYFSMRTRYFHETSYVRLVSVTALG